MKTFWKFIINIAIVAVGVVVIDIVVGKVLDHILFNAPLCDAPLAYINYAERDLDSSDVLIIGSSKANHNYDARMMSDSLKMNVFNAGMDGRGITYYAAILNAVCGRTTPDVVVLDLTYDDFSGRKADRITELRPYFNQDDYVAEMIKKGAGNSEYYCSYSSMYRYNSLLSAVLKLISATANNSLTGYLPLPADNSADNLELTQADYDVYEVDSVCYGAFADMVALSESKGFDLMVVFSPEYALHSPVATDIEVCHSLGVEPSVYTDVDKYLVNKHIYKDIFHMNRLGAEMFTEDIIREIKTNHIKE